MTGREYERRQMRIHLTLSASILAIIALGGLLIERPAIKRIEAAAEVLNAPAVVTERKVIKYAPVKAAEPIKVIEPEVIIVEQPEPAKFPLDEETAEEEEIWVHPLSEDEIRIAASVVMGEAGGESYDGKLAVAQCLRNGCDFESVEPSELRVKYQYSGFNPAYTDDCERAVLEAFRDGGGVTEQDIMFFYAPRWCSSAWHESQKFVCEIGGHRFFAVNV